MKRKDNVSGEGEIRHLEVRTSYRCKALGGFVGVVDKKGSLRNQAEAGGSKPSSLGGGRVGTKKIKVVNRVCLTITKGKESRATIARQLASEEKELQIGQCLKILPFNTNGARTSEFEKTVVLKGAQTWG